MVGIGGVPPTLRGRVPALDGLRGIAVIAVLVFHADGLLPGGYIGVSTFFTLSGFLITSTSLDAERSARGFTASRFYAGRIRRLAPAATICFLGIFWLEWQFQAFARGPLRSESTWAVAQLYNWNVLLANRSYEELFTATATPFMHFWSLAIEEQFYLLFPLVILVHRTTSSDRRFLAYAVGAFLTTAALAVLIAAVFGPDAAYYATPARATEIIAGVVLALVVRGGWLPRWARALAPAGFVALLVAMVLTPDRTAAWTYHGGFAVIAVLSALAIVAALGTGPVRQLLQSAPLVFLGTISYGLYLFHWPIFLLLQSRYPELDGWQVLAVGSLFGIGVATLSYVLVERPILAMALLPRRAIAGLAAPVLAVAAIGMLLPVERRAEPVTALADIDQAQLHAIELRPAAPVASTPPSAAVATLPVASTPPPADDLSLLVVGDSTAVALGAGLVDHIHTSAAPARLAIEASGSCGILSGGHYEDPVLDRRAADDVPGPRVARRHRDDRDHAAPHRHRPRHARRLLEPLMGRRGDVAAGHGRGVHLPGPRRLRALRHGGAGCRRPLRGVDPTTDVRSAIG